MFHGFQDAQLQTMVDVRAPRSSIYDFLLRHGENVNCRDVDNMIAQHRSKISTVDDNEQVALTLADFAAEDPFNLVTVDESQRGHTGVISLCSRSMRSAFERFPELVLLDCTHKTNRFGCFVIALCVWHVFTMFSVCGPDTIINSVH
jgi:hypothetical protein